ncbi:serine protease [Paenibacillus sp. PK3_47]|uniref:CAP domain-containing protein n=1 Tax=Paenibacillus sp. PK3_47 TaxID=2072642 RepID=UPI00201D9D12|nr:CAP domain-containing protein [Paenibacillus sp. PK3_47]UQZ32336.1 serine protease [Paenibacillus sp. PK3_47]
MKSKTLKAMIGGSVAAVMALSISLPSQAGAAAGTAATTGGTVNITQLMKYFNQYSNNTYTFGNTTVTVSKGQAVANPAKPAAPSAKPAATAKPVAVAKPAATAKPVATAKPAATAKPVAAVPAANATFVQQVVSLVNKERAAAGLSAVTALDSLNKVAAAKATDMRSNNYFSHTSPTYGSPFDMMTQFGVTYRAAGENIAMGQKTPQEVMTAWMNSEGHRANILSPNFNYIGVGYDNNYWVQEFIGK